VFSSIVLLLSSFKGVATGSKSTLPKKSFLLFNCKLEWQLAIRHAFPCPDLLIPKSTAVLRLGWSGRVLYVSAMTELEQTVLSALLELEGMIEEMPRANPKPNLLPIFSRLDDLARRLPLTTDPTLLHYLHKKSYQKARLFLQGREADNARGNCHGHVDDQGRAWTAERNPNSVSVEKGASNKPRR
jgi:hypothetical protein